MKYVFITGIPTAGKSYLANKVAKQTNSIHINLDTLRMEMLKDSKIEPYVTFFLNKNENEYWQTSTPEQHWTNLVQQSEAFWPTFLNKIKAIQKTKQSAIFEAVNILPHLASQDLDFQGIVLLGESKQTVLERLNENARWGRTMELHKMEAEWFFKHEGAKYKSEAKKYGYKSFNYSKNAEIELLKLLS